MAQGETTTNFTDQAIDSAQGFLVNGTTVINSSGKIVESAGIEIADGDSFDDTNGNEALEFTVTASAVNHLGVVNSATGNNPILRAEGEADTGITFDNSEGEEILILDSIATSVNQVTIKSAATGNPAIFAQDGEDDVGFEFHAKNSEEILKLEATAAATTFVSVKSQSTGNNPEISAEGEADLGLTLMNDQAEELAIFDCVATGVNEITFRNAAAGGAPRVSATGGDTNINLSLRPKGTGSVTITTGLTVAAQSVTPNNTSDAASTVNDGTVSVDVQAVTNNANDWIVLPSLANVPNGHEITILCNAGGNFELRTPATSAEEINSEDCDGTKEYLCTNTEIIKVIKINNTIGWMAHAYSAIGAVVTAVVPD